MQIQVGREVILEAGVEREIYRQGDGEKEEENEIDKMISSLALRCGIRFPESLTAGFIPI